MAIEIPRGLVEFILLGPEDDRRQLQDSPLLGDVWMEFAKNPGARLDLLITPHKEKTASSLAHILAGDTKSVNSNIAYLQGIVAASLTFEEILKIVIPRTCWWSRARTAKAIQQYFAPESKALEQDIDTIFRAAAKWHQNDAELKWEGEAIKLAMRDQGAHQRYVALAGLVLWATNPQNPKETATGQEQRILNKKTASEVARELRTLIVSEVKPEERSIIWNVSLNRQATAAIARSVPAVKADAAATLFKVDCSKIVWAVIDSGIDGTHPAFKRRGSEKVRVKRSFDFTRIREIVSLDNVKPEKSNKCIEDLLRPELKATLTPKAAEAFLKTLANGAAEGRQIDWGLVEPLVEIKPETKPEGNHGTHVAGILAASKGGAQQPEQSEDEDDSDNADGMCPDITLYDFRVLAPNLPQTEFAIIAALQFIRYPNEKNSYLTIHGANLSLSIRHDVRNYACGRTPICNECERLVNSGVVVVAAAGNRGYQNFETKEGLYESYAAFSVTDPGNGDSVITVGATHRFSPHTYGVSFFSSRGPTGDGRMKPDLVAPGERVRAPLAGGGWGDLDGTSMAAPHVSGAAAMLMARYSELIGQPRRVKQILCDSATDLGRERSFQGHGMLDVLRAFQSI